MPTYRVYLCGAFVGLIRAASALLARIRAAEARLVEPEDLPGVDVTRVRPGEQPIPEGI